MAAKKTSAQRRPRKPICFDDIKFAGPIIDVAVPDGYLRFSDAISRLANGMWGGLRRPAPVATAKRYAKKGSIGFGPWQECAGKRLTTAATKGDLPVYVVAKPQVRFKSKSKKLNTPEQLEPVVVPVSVLKKQIPTSRGVLSDHPIQPSLKSAGGDAKLHRLLVGGLFVVRANDFERWYRSERTKGNWPSQRSSSKPRIGRPTKQTEALRKAILASEFDRTKNGKINIASLRRRLVASGSRPPRADTLARLVSQLHCETGEPELFRTSRKRRTKA